MSTPADVSQWSWGTWTVMEWALTQNRSQAALSPPSSKVTHQLFPRAEFDSWWKWTSVNWGASIPSILPLALKELYLASSKILVIPSDVFSELSELEKLDLSHNQITEKGIKKAAFGNIIKLENSNLAEYLLTGVPQNLHSFLKDLRLDKRRRV